MTKAKTAIANDESDEVTRQLYKRPGHLIRRLHQISISIFLAESKKYDLTHLQYGSLVLVDTNPGIDQSRLARAIALDRQTVSTVVRRLIEKGLLRREAKDRRTSALYVTGAGKALHHMMSGRLESVDRTILAPLAPVEREAFMEFLSRMVDQLNDLSRAPQSNVEDDQPPRPRKRRAKADSSSAATVP